MTAQTATQTPPGTVATPGAVAGPGMFAGPDARGGAPAGIALPQGIRLYAVALGFGVLHYVVALVTLVWHSQPGFAVFWPAAGLAAGAMIVVNRRSRLLMVPLGMVAVALANISVGRPIFPSFVFGLCDMMESLLVATIADRLMGPGGSFDRLRHMAGFVVAAVLGTAVTAIVAATLFKHLFGSPDDFLDLTQQWFDATFVGVCTFAPLVIMLPALLRQPPPMMRLVEGALLLVALAVASWVLYAGLLPHAGVLRLFSGSTFIFPLVLWIAARAPQAFAGAAISVVALVVVYCTSHGLGRLGDPALPIDDRVLAAQLTMLTFAGVALAISTLFGERRRAEASLRTANAELSALSASLEKRVAERTRDLRVANRELTRQATERERVTAELRESEAWHRAAQRVAGLGSFSLGATPAPGHHWSDEARRIVGALPDGAPATIDLFVSTLVDEPDRARVRAALEDARRGRIATSIDYRVVAPGGERRSVVTAIEPETDAAGTTRLLCTAIDMTERNAIEQKLAEYRAELLHVVRVATAGELASVMAHEVNQPLSAISHTASALIRLDSAGRLAPADLTEHLGEISAQAQRASGIIRQIRQFVQKRPAAVRPLDVDVVIRDILRLVEPVARRQNVRLEHVRSGAGAWIVGEEIQLGQLFVNLLRNAIDAAALGSGGERHVWIESRLGGAEVTIDVRDNGPGIDDRVREHMFDPFFTTKDDGLGMGLPISRTIAQAHGGTLEALASPASGGTAFRVRLPASRASVAAGAAPPEPGPAERGAAERGPAGRLAG